MNSTTNCEADRLQHHNKYKSLKPICPQCSAVVNLCGVSCCSFQLWTPINLFLLHTDFILIPPFSPPINWCEPHPVILSLWHFTHINQSRRKSSKTSCYIFHPSLGYGFTIGGFRYTICQKTDLWPIFMTGEVIKAVRKIYNSHSLYDMS